MSKKEETKKCNCGQTLHDYDGVHLCLKCNGKEIMKIAKVVYEKSIKK